VTRAIRVRALGGPEVLSFDEVTVGEPGPGEARVRHTAIGLNFIDVYFRTGLYPGPELPFVLGLEAAGVVEAVGADVAEIAAIAAIAEIAIGDRVAYACRPLGAYAEARILPADRLVRLPDGIDDETAAAIMLKGMTAQYLLRRTYRVEAGVTILVHAAAGGVGTLLCQWAKHLGATVIGTVGSEEKAELARAYGCDHPILYREEDFVRRTRELTDGAGVPVVYDSVGAATFTGSLDCLAPLGTMVAFGQSSGAPPPLELGELARRGSLFLTRPSLLDYTRERVDLVASAEEVFAVVGSGAVRTRIGARWPLDEAAGAQAALEGRLTQGATVLLP